MRIEFNLKLSWVCKLNVYIFYLPLVGFELGALSLPVYDVHSNQNTHQNTHKWTITEKMEKSKSLRRT